jgi:hypothetical protein
MALPAAAQTPHLVLHQPSAAERRRLNFGGNGYHTEPPSFNARLITETMPISQAAHAVLCPGSNDSSPSRPAGCGAGSAAHPRETPLAAPQVEMGSLAELLGSSAPLQAEPESATTPRTLQLNLERLLAHEAPLNPANLICRLLLDGAGQAAPVHVRDVTPLRATLQLLATNDSPSAYANLESLGNTLPFMDDRLLKGFWNPLCKLALEEPELARWIIWNYLRLAPDNVASGIVIAPQPVPQPRDPLYRCALADLTDLQSVRQLVQELIGSQTPRSDALVARLISQLPEEVRIHPLELVSKTLCFPKCNRLVPLGNLQLLKFCRTTTREVVIWLQNETPRCYGQKRLTLGEACKRAVRLHEQLATLMVLNWAHIDGPELKGAEIQGYHRAKANVGCEYEWPPLPSGAICRATLEPNGLRHQRTGSIFTSFSCQLRGPGNQVTQFRKGSTFFHEAMSDAQLLQLLDRVVERPLAQEGMANGEHLNTIGYGRFPGSSVEAPIILFSYSDEGVMVINSAFSPFFFVEGGDLDGLTAQLQTLAGGPVRLKVDPRQFHTHIHQRLGASEVMKEALLQLKKLAAAPGSPAKNRSHTQEKQADQVRKAIRQLLTALLQRQVAKHRSADNLRDLFCYQLREAPHRLFLQTRFSSLTGEPLHRLLSNATGLSMAQELDQCDMLLVEVNLQQVAEQLVDLVVKDFAGSLELLSRSAILDAAKKIT